MPSRQTHDNKVLNQRFRKTVQENLMNKWHWLFLAVSVWMAVGYAIYGSGTDQHRGDTPLLHQANRIVSMAPNLTEILFALGMDAEIVGVTLFSDYPPAAMKKAKVGSFWQPNIEAIIASRPDLVITMTTTNFNQQKYLATRLNRMGYDCPTFHLETIADLFETIDKIGQTTGRQSEANRLTTDLKTKLARLSALVDTGEKIKVLYVVQRHPLRVAGRDTFVNEMIELAGGENAIGPTIHKYPPIGAEQVIGSGAEVIIEQAMAQNNISEQKKSALEYWSRFNNLPAVQNGQIYVIKGDTVARLGPRLYEGIETIARCLKPHLFEN